MISQLLIKREITSKCWRRNKICSFNRNCSKLSSDFQHQNLISLLQSCDQIPQTSQIHCLMLKTGWSRPNPVPAKQASRPNFDAGYRLLRLHIQADKTPQALHDQHRASVLRGHSAASGPRNGLLLFNRIRAENLSEDLASDQFTFIGDPGRARSLYGCSD